MAIIRKRFFSTGEPAGPDDFSLIDTPEKLLRYAQHRGLDPVPLDVKSVAEFFGINVQEVDLEDELSGILGKDEENDTWFMQVNINHHPNRQRYTIAHELGHFCLHRHLKQRFEDQIFFRGGEITREEGQANEFASTILIPEQELRGQIDSGVKKVEELARVFGVSTLALRIRAKNLGLSGHGL
jgi:Zn-dependent peptidase ImmA (M78 family)